MMKFRNYIAANNPEISAPFLCSDLFKNIVMAIFLSLPVFDVSAQVVENFQASGDAEIWNNTPLDETENYGACNILYLNGATTSPKQRMLLKFDISSLPVNATISNSTLRLVKIGGNNTSRSVSVHRITNDWTEGAGVCAGTVGPVSWQQRVTSTNWTTAGGDFAASATASTNVAGNAAYTWNVTSLVQDWYNGTHNNYGLLTKFTTENVNEERQFASKENATTANRPVLSVVYTLAEPVFDNVSSGVATSGTSVTVSHTTGSSANRLMLVGVSTRNRDITVGSPGDEVSSVTYGGENMIFVGTEGSNTDAETFIFMMIDPPSGTANVVVNFTAALGGNNAGVVGVVTYSNVDQVNPIGSYFSSAGNSAAPSLTVNSTNTGQIVYNVLAATTDATTVTTNSKQLERWFNNANRPVGSGYTRDGQSSSTTLSYTLSASQRWSLSGVAINAMPEADLSVSKAVNNSTPFRGQTISFTVTATNNGPDYAPNVLVTDVLPAGYTFVSATPSVGTYNSSNGVWDIGTLNASASATLTLQVVVNNSGPYLNTASVTGSVIDNTSGNNSSQATITICNAGSVRPLINN